jgi:hypothetical protein
VNNKGHSNKLEKYQITDHSFANALLANAKHLSIFEKRPAFSSEEFYKKLKKRKTENSIDFIEWAIDY